MADDTPGVPFEAYKALLEGVKNEIIAKMSEKETPLFRLVTLLLPIVLTSLLSLWVYRVQASISDKVDRESKALQARLGLTQDYYKARLKIYQDVHVRVVNLLEKTAVSAGAPPSAAELDDSIGELHHSYSTSSIFLTRSLLSDLSGLWNQAMTANRSSDSIKSEQVDAIAAAADAVEARMREDLLIDELSAAQIVRQPLPRS